MEAETEDCICERLRGCGGIDMFRGDCPEHGFNAKPQGLFHTHALQVDKVTRGRWVP